MTALPNRISATGQLTTQQEIALAQEFLEIQSEEELDQFLPLLLPLAKMAAPLLMKAAGPLLKGVAGSLFGGGGSSRKRPRDQQEQFLGKIVGGLFGETEAESEEEEQFLGNILKGLMGEQELEAEEEQFLGGIIGKLFGKRELELEAENYVQEQFLGGIIGKLFGGRELELEEESGGAPSPQRQLRLARRFVRLASTASRQAAMELTNQLRAGQKPSLDDARRIVFGAIVTAARRFTPRLAAAAFHGGGAPAPGPRPPQHQQQHQQQQQQQQEHEEEWMGEEEGGRDGSMLELMIEPVRAKSASNGANGHPWGQGGGQGTWVRQGDRLILTV